MRTSWQVRQALRPTRGWRRGGGRRAVLAGGPRSSTTSGFGFHADDCAPGILELLGPVRERHVNVLIDTARVRPLLAEHGVRATIGDSFGSGVELLSGLHTIIGHKDP